MSLLDIAAVFTSVIAIIIAFQVSGIRSHIRNMSSHLRSLDEELFRLAQEQNPHYGICSQCGLRAVVRHVLPEDGKPNPDEVDMFYCQPCWWLSSTMRLGEEGKYYKDRLSKRAAFAEKVGPS